jgi:hypothetical protein
MEPKAGQHIKIGFKNGTQLEGVVVEWSEKKSALTSIANDAFFVIMDTAADVLVYQLPIEQQPAKSLNQLEQEFEEVRQQPSNDLRLKTLAQLKTAIIEQDKQIVANKLKQHTPSNVNPVQYGSPLLRK